jgi:hypothetical protein
MECAHVLSQWLSKTREKVKIVRVDVVLKCANVWERYLQIAKAFHYVNLIQKVDKFSFLKTKEFGNKIFFPIYFFLVIWLGKFPTREVKH